MKVRFFKPEQSDPERDQGIKVPYGPAKRKLAIWRWYLVLLLVASPILYFLFKIGYATAVVSAPAFVRQEQLTIRAKSAGFIDEVLVEPSQQVHLGDPLIKLKNEDLRIRKRELEAELADLQQLQNQITVSGGSTAGLIADLKAQLHQAEQQRDYYAQRVDDISSLVDQGAATQAELSAAQSDYQRALSRISDLHQAIADNGGTRTQTIIQPRIRTIRAELSSIEQRLDDLVVRAPQTGRITQVSVTAGDQLAMGSSVAKLVPSDARLHISAYISPEDGDYAHIGQRGEVKLPNGETYLAEITDVPDVAARVPRGEMTLFNDAKLAVLVKMKLIDNGRELPSMVHGLPVRVRFINDWESNIDINLQQKLSEVRQLGKEQWVWLQKTIQNWRS